MITIKTTMEQLGKALNNKCYLFDNRNVADTISNYVGKKPMFHLYKFNSEFKTTERIEICGLSAQRAFNKLNGQAETPVTIETCPAGHGVFFLTDTEQVFATAIDPSDSNYFHPMYPRANVLR